MSDLTPNETLLVHAGTQMLVLDPTELQIGDVVLFLGEHEMSGCHCDVRVTVIRPYRPSCCAEGMACVHMPDDCTCAENRLACAARHRAASSDTGCA